MHTWESYLTKHHERFMEELLDFLSIPSISALPEHAKDVWQAAEWLENRLKKAGIESLRIMPTGGHPVVYGDWLHAPGKPTVLIYGHFDTQPVDPIDLWESPPFAPQVKDGRIYARGASDNKGNLFVALTLIEAMLKTDGKLPLNVKILFEGQEEIGSPQLEPFLAAHQNLFSCDLVISSDGGQWSEDQPALVMGTRGITAVFVDVQGPAHDLHSGGFGGAVANPIHALAYILNSLHDAEGRVTVPGFYDQVRPLSKEEREEMARVPFDEQGYLEETGAPALFGEPGFSTYERTWARPTLEVNGISGGFQGEGMKTVLPSRACAKISCRLVKDQDPAHIAELVVNHIHKVAPPGVKVTIGRRESGSFPYLIDPKHRGLSIAESVLKEIYGKSPYKIRSGGTIPVNAMFLKYLNAHTLVFGFGLNDERLHSPNEFFRISSFKKGQIAYGKLLSRLAEG